MHDNRTDTNRCKMEESEIRKRAGVSAKDFWMSIHYSCKATVYTVNGPNKFSWEGVACCPYGARVSAYDAYERHLREGTRGN
jgi:hypothetical protein